MQNGTDYDVLIIGGGQAGIPLAYKLADEGRSVALAERKDLGGSCVNFGCTPAALTRRRQPPLVLHRTSISLTEGDCDRAYGHGRRRPRGSNPRAGVAGLGQTMMTEASGRLPSSCWCRRFTVSENS